MQGKREKTQTAMTLLPSLEKLIPRNYWLRRLHRVLDLGFVHEAVRPCYCQDNGRRSIDPEVIVRLFLLQAITRTSSVRELMQEVALHVGYRWFIGYELHEPLPDHSTLSKALDRFGDEVFDELFRRSIAQCRASGLIKGELLHVDATTIRADLAKARVNGADSPDPDARFGRFPDGTKQPGYKQHTVVDDHSRVIVAVGVTPANVNEGGELVSLVDRAAAELGERPAAVCADSAYASGANAAACEARGVRLVSPPRAARNHHSQEQFPIEQFRYDEGRDVFICPNGKVLIRVGRFSGKKERYKYRASARDCGGCRLKGQCTQSTQRCLNVSLDHAALVRLRADRETDGFKQRYRRRGPVVEGIFAEAKQRHGLGRCWWRGLAKTRRQCLLIATVLNLKRLAAHIADFWRRCLRPELLRKHLGSILRLLGRLRHEFSIYRPHRSLSSSTV